jgi:hypothetical protein
VHHNLHLILLLCDKEVMPLLLQVDALLMMLLLG